MGSQAGDEDVEASFEFGGSVIACEDGGEAAEEGELSDRESMQAEAEQGVGLVRVVDQLLEFVEDVAVQEAEE